MNIFLGSVPSFDDNIILLHIIMSFNHIIITTSVLCFLYWALFEMIIGCYMLHGRHLASEFLWCNCSKCGLGDFLYVITYLLLSLGMQGHNLRFFSMTQSEITSS